jgi:succinate dehydrogenase hydrophobic anchor subunit
MQMNQETTARSIKLPRWNWGAFFLTWIWGLGNRSFVGLSLFLVVIGVASVKAMIINYASWLNRDWVMQGLTYLIFAYMIAMHLLHGWYGYRWAWNDESEQSFVRFQRKQRIWGISGAIIWLLLLLSMTSAVYWLKQNQIFQQSLAIAKNDPILQTYIGKPINVSLWSLRGEVSQQDRTGSAYYKFTAKGQWQSAVVVVEARKEQGVWAIKQQIAIVPNIGIKQGNSQLLLFGQPGYFDYRS